MTVNESPGGFAGDPTAALTVAGSTGCCGNPAQSTNIALPDPADSTGGTCCGTPAAAVAANSCCAPAAKADAVATGQGCCG
ncbi:hypothetical protein ACQEVC_34085 [Plantactinospora sp. CA-294935]|uniref:Uncharacterized protein n=1 Tax=Plantactinospora alkalitolerans TaxID=2789879 RepID=A0ABS0GYS3_9ACTN|nr:hypothetical protein [Plantactinospora alkalitolerans]MBF9131079.1 hypothetical protein [Plantactinospora alkalitolerans]